MTAHRLRPALFVVIPLACFDPPELDEAPPPLADLGPVDTWAAIDESSPPAGDDGPASNDGGPPADGDGTESDPDAGLDPALEQLRLTEVLVDPEGADGGPNSPEFIEIKNPGPLPVKLDGLTVIATSWPVLDADEIGLAGLVLEVDDLLVIRRWATDVEPALSTLEISGSVIWTGFLHSSGLRNSDGSVTLEVGATVIDQLDYGVDPVPTTGSSLCRLDDGWTSCAPSPGLLELPDEPPEGPIEPMPIPPGAVQIVEVWANPPGPSTEEKIYEFIEIINISENEVELSDCRVGDSPQPDAAGIDPLEHVEGDGGCESLTCLAPGARAIIVGQGYLGETGGALVLATDDTTIADGGLTNTEPVVLWSPRGEAISTYRIWPDPAGEPLPSDEQPLHRIEPSAEDAPESWISAPATPGA